MTLKTNDTEVLPINNGTKLNSNSNTVPLNSDQHDYLNYFISKMVIKMKNIFNLKIL